MRNEDDRGQTDIYLVILSFYTIGKRNAFRPLSSAPLSQSRQGALAIVELRSRRNHIKIFEGSTGMEVVFHHGHISASKSSE